METRNEFMPKVAILPGSVLKLELEERNIRQKDFAKEIGMPASNLNEYINGKRSFTADFSLKLEGSLGIPADIWMNLQQNHNLSVARREQLDIEEQEAFNHLEKYDEIISIKDLKKRIGITSVSGKKIFEQLIDYLNLPPVEQLKSDPLVQAYFKKSSKLKSDPRMVLSWTLLAKAEMKNVEASGVFDIGKKDQLITELRTVFHENNDTINRVKEILSNNGIKFGIVEKLDSTPIDGYSFHDGHAPCIVVTKRRDAIDNLAFVVMHELGHVLQHIITNQGKEFVAIEQEERVDKCEREADNFATHSLIPESLWRKSPAVRLESYLIQRKYSEWADSLHLNRWIVLGRIGHELNFWKFKSDGTRQIL